MLLGSLRWSSGMLCREFHGSESGCRSSDLGDHIRRWFEVNGGVRDGFVAGLEGVVAAETRLSSVDGEAGELIVAGFPVEELAGRASFEETVYLLWHDVLPDAEQLAAFREALAGRRALPPATVELLRAVAAEGVPAMDALRMAAGTVSLGGGGGPREEVLAVVG